jgi:flavin reductase (DIM6/NTAB) family NADH-FMN oxidoreductase RutF
VAEPVTGTLLQPSPDRKAAGEQALRTVFAAFTTGVTVVTIGGPVPHGMTANSFASVSLDPALVLVCVARDAVLGRRLPTAGAFAISVLGAGQERIARHFADRSRPPGARQFDRTPNSAGPHTGAPLLDSALAWIECGLWQIHSAGDHSIVVGKVRAAWRGGGGGALVFFDGHYAELFRPQVRTGS